MRMTPRIRKFALTLHITSSVGWLGAVAGFLALPVGGLTSRDEQVVRAANLAMQLTGGVVIVPLSFVALLTGLVQSLGTKRGLFRNSLRAQICSHESCRRKQTRLADHAEHQKQEEACEEHRRRRCGLWHFVRFDQQLLRHEEKQCGASKRENRRQNRR